MATNQLQPLRSGTRQRTAKVGQIAYAANSALTPLELPRVGLLNRLMIQFRGTVTLSAAGALTDQGPWNILQRLRVNANIGAASIVDLSGFGAFMIQPLVEELGFRPDLAGAGGGTTPNADIHAAPVAMGANTWVVTWVIPIAANDGMQFASGLVNLQSPETRVTVELLTGNLTDPASNVTGITGNFNVYYWYYELPDPRQFALPPLMLVRWIEDQQAILGTGDTLYAVPRQGILLQLAHAVTINGTRSDLVDSLTVKFNKTDSPYVEERQWARVLERMRYGLNPNTGVFYHDFWHAGSDVSAGDTRDAIDTEELSTLESIVTVNSGAGLGANNNFLKSCRRILQFLQ